MASAIALFGPWPDSSMRLAEVVRHCHRRQTTARGVAANIVVFIIKRGGRRRSCGWMEAALHLRLQTVGGGSMVVAAFVHWIPEVGVPLISSANR